MEIDNLISGFKLDTLDDSWVDAVWDNEFMQVEDLAEEYLKSVDFDVIVQEFKAEIKRILNSNSAGNNEPIIIWDSLGLHVRRLLPVIYYFIKQGKCDNEDNDSRTACVNAASLYFILLSIPGSSAYKVFRRLLYEVALDSFKLSSLLRDETSNRRRNRNDEAFDDEGNQSLFYGQKQVLAEELNSALLDLICLLRSFSLKDKSDSFELTVQIVTALTLVDSKNSQLNFSESQTSNYILPTHKKLDDLLHSLTYNAYVALHLLARGRLQNNVPCVELVLDNLLPGLAWGGSNGSTKERTTIRQNMLRFVKQCLLPIAKDEKHLEDTILTLVRHLCGAAVRMTVDVRRLVAATIIELMVDMPSVLPILDWIIKFSHSEKSNHRLMSVEILGHMLLKSKDM